MCGICGVINFNFKKRIEQSVIKKMSDSIAHRGPDDEGYYIENNVGLGHRRLSIIDVAGGRQPIYNEIKTVCIVFNGEIYNYLELKVLLIKKGHKFYTSSDTEVIIHLYEEFGDECVTMLNGMFAFAIWDNGKKKLLLARDRLGIKPLFYKAEDSRIIFGSEIKPILTCDLFKRELDFQALHDYLTFKYIPAPRTIFKGIRKLLPGHILVYKEGKIKLEKYWDVSYPSYYNDAQNKHFYIEKLDRMLSESVRRRLMSDVPLGAFLSGGIDSSAIVAYMSQLKDQPVKTFSIGFEEESFSELDYAKIISERFKTDHTELIVRPDIEDLVYKLSEMWDEPFADSSAIPTFLVSKLAREKVKVVLSGDGGDEVFAGYETYLAYQLAQYYKRIPGLLRKRVIENIVRSLPVSSKKASFDFKAKRFIEGIELPLERRHLLWMSQFYDGEKDELYTKDFKNELKNSFEVLEAHLGDELTSDPLSRLQFLDQKVYLPDDILVKVDRMSMMNSLEARVPLLDHELVEFVATIPSALKLKRLKTKYIFKKLLEKKLPEEILNRKKAGFSIPVSRWLKDDLKELALDILSKKKIEQQGYFNYRSVDRLLEQHFRSVKDNSRQIWTLLMFGLWAGRYMN